MIVPTYNEAFNIAVLLDKITDSLSGRRYEIVVVDDDSPDETWRVAQARARSDRRITVVRRKAERGLSSAVLTGMTVATGETLVVMDADLQHDPGRIPALVSAILDDGFDICLGSRAADGGSYGTFGKRRRFVSWVGAILARIVLQVPVRDPMSGFFAISRQRFESVSADVNPRGFKILLEFLARGSKPAVTEVGYRFGERMTGETKLSGSVVLDYVTALAVLGFSRRR